MSLHFEHKIVTLSRHILDEQRQHPEAQGILTTILDQMALAGKLIAYHTTRAGLADILGSTNEINVQGETVQKLDVYAHRTLFRMLDHTGCLAAMGSEEAPELLAIPDHHPVGKYILLFDPLDGSSNIDVNISIGTIFGVWRRLSDHGPGELRDALQPGNQLVAAGYLIYGPSTMMVYSTGDGVHGFTLDPSIGEFLLSHPHIQLPSQPKYYSANQGYYRRWSPGVQQFTDELQTRDLSLRYVGSMIADVHRTLLSGGIFYYPADSKNPQGKLRQQYEVAPLSFLIQQAGGYSSNGVQNVLDLPATSLHQRTPVFMGNRDLVKRAEVLIAEQG